MRYKTYGDVVDKGQIRGLNKQSMLVDRASLVEMINILNKAARAVEDHIKNEVEREKLTKELLAMRKQLLSSV